MIDAAAVAAAIANAPASPGWGDAPSRIPITLSPDARTFRVVVPPRETKTITGIFGAHYNTAAGWWEVPATRAQLWQLARLFQGRTDAAPEVHTLADIWAQEAERQERIRESHEPVGRDEYIDTRRPHQVQGTFFFALSSGLLADEPGLGKTLQAIDWMRLSRPGPTLHLVATTASTKINWGLEVERWWPQARPVVVPASPVGARRKAMDEAVALSAEMPVVLIMAHAQLAMHSKQQALPGRVQPAARAKAKELNDMTFTTMVIDEAHKLRGYDTAFRAAALVLGRQAGHRLALTGTPKERSDDDLWAIMSWVAPEEWGNRDEFRHMYCTLGESMRGTVNHGIKPGIRPEVDMILQPRYLRRTKALLPGLPEKNPIEWRIVDLLPPQRKAYDALARDYGVVINGEVLTEAHAATLQAHLFQLASAMPVVDDGKVVRLAKPSAKLAVLLDILDDGGDEPLVIYTASRKFAELIHQEILEEGYSSAMVTGRQTEKQRQRAVEQFQAGQVQVIVGTIGAGAEGITLHRSNRVVLAELDWLASKNNQAIDRVHRIGQSRIVTPIALVSVDTVDVLKAMVHLGREIDAQTLLRDPGRFMDGIRGTYDLAQAIRDHNR